MRKWLVPTFLALVCLMTVTVSAMEVKAERITPKLSFSGTRADCEVTVREYGSDIDVTMELWCGSTLVDSWSDEGVSSVTLTGSCRVERGKTYTLEAYGTVDGVSFTATPIRKTC